MGAWGEACVTEANEALSRARQMGETVHFGRFCELCHERASELEDGDPELRMKAAVSSSETA